MIIGNCGGAGEECKQERFLACSLMSTVFDKNVSYEFFFLSLLSKNYQRANQSKEGKTSRHKQLSNVSYLRILNVMQSFRQFSTCLPGT